MRILAIDQSFRCSGLVVFENTKMIHCECFKTDTSDPDKFYRAYMISNYIAKMVKEHEIEHIMMEGLAFGGRGDATRDLGGLLYAIIIKVSIEGNMPITLIAPTALKKYASGNGRASKQDMIDALPEKIYNKFIELGYLKTKGLPDLADAYFLGRMHEKI